MRTPAGKECQYFYGDYYRGRDHEECRLLSSVNPPLLWKRDMCSTCPVPEILLANACEHMVLTPQLNRPFPFTKQQVRISAFCLKNGREVTEPQIGCGECHVLPAIFNVDSNA